VYIIAQAGEATEVEEGANNCSQAMGQAAKKL